MIYRKELGTTKIFELHKSAEVPLCPVIYLINTPTHKLAKMLYDDLKNAIPLPKSHINNSFEFVNKLKNINVLDDDVLILLHAVSLFTNVTCEQVIKSLEKRAHHIRRE